MNQPTSNDIGVMLYGKVQPANTEAEEVVIGALLIEPASIDIVYNILTPAMFYKEDNQAIYRAVVSLYSQSKSIDLVTVAAQLRVAGELDLIGGSFALAEKSNRVGSAANIKNHALLIYEAHLKREMIKIGSATIQESYDDSNDVFELIDRQEKKVEKLTQKIYGEKGTEIRLYVGEAHGWIHESQKNSGLAGVATGIYSFDAASGGFVNGELIVVAARPGMGKTAFVVNCMRNQASEQFKLPVGIMSLEMVGRELTVRMLGAEARVDGEKIKRGQLSPEELSAISNATTVISELSIQIDDRSDVNVHQIKHIARRWKLKYDIKVLYVDYLQIIRPSDEDQRKNRNDQIGGMTRALKILAKTLNIPVVLLSQLSRSVEDNKNKIPTLSDLRESGNIEQDADVVVFLYRPEYYGYMSAEDTPNTRGLCQAICAKNRNGKLFTASMYFNTSQSRFDSWDSSKAKPKEAILNDTRYEKQDNGASNGKTKGERRSGNANPQQNNLPPASEGDVPF